MAITFVASGTFASGTGTVSPGLPSGWAADDVHVLVVESAGGDGDPGSISGWTRINGVYNTGGGTDRAGCTVYLRVAVGGDSAPTVPDSGNHTSARIHGFRGVDTTTPQDATAVTTENNSNSTSLSITGITTANDGAMVCYCAAHGDDGASWSSLGGHNLASITDVYNSHTQGNDGSNHCAYGIMTTAGGSGTLTGTIGASEHTAAVVIALRPGGDSLTLDDTESNTETDTVTLGQTHVLTLDDAQSVTEASTVTLGGEHSLTLDDTEGNTEAGSITVAEISSFDLFLDDTEITTETSAVTVGVIRNLTLDDSESATEAASVTLGQEHTLTLDDAESGSEVSTVNFSESNQILFDDVETSTEVTAITIGAVHNFQLVSAESGTEAGSTALGQEHVLNVDNAESNTEAGSIALSENVDILAPDGDTTVGNWTDEGGASIDLYQSIDETPANDSDYIQSENSPVNSATKISLSNPSGSVNPSGPHLLSYRYQKRPSDADQQIDLVVRLIEGASTEIASWTHTNISTTVVQVQQQLTAPQVGAIGNYADLHLEFEGDAP